MVTACPDALFLAPVSLALLTLLHHVSLPLGLFFPSQHYSSVGLSLDTHPPDSPL